jgi:hypothetical protein
MTVTAAESIALTLQKVKAVGKNERNQQQNFNYRGIDAVVNAVNPVLAEVGGFIVGEALSTEYEAFVSAKGTAGTVARLTVRYKWYGTDGGEPVTGVVSSEANDYADKATAKAWSVALRTFLLQTLMLPTDDPDPDSSYIERGAPRAQATEVVSPLPPVDEQAAHTWITVLSAAESIAQLQASWDEAGKEGVTRDPKVIAAKDKRKQELTNA